MLKTAYQMIADDGIEKFTIRNLSKRLNISHNTMYRHFKSKYELIYTLLEEEIKLLSDATRAAIERDDLEDIDKFKECLFCAVEFATNNPHIYKLMFAMEVKDKDLSKNFKATYGEYYYQLINLIETLLESGKFKKGTRFTIMNTTWALLHGIAMLLADNILPLSKDMNSLPQLLNSKPSEDNSSRAAGYSDIRNLSGFSINALVNSFLSSHSP